MDEWLIGIIYVYNPYALSNKSRWNNRGEMHVMIEIYGFYQSSEDFTRDPIKRDSCSTGSK